MLLKAVKSGKEFTAKSLESGELIFEGIAQSTDLEPDETVIELLKKVVVVEEYLGAPLNLPDKLSPEDCRGLDYVYDLVSGKEHNEKYLEFSASFTLGAKITNTDKIADGSVFSIEFMAERDVRDFLGQTFKLPIKRKIDGAKFKDVEKAKKLAELLEAGDTLKLDFVPADGYDAIQFIDTLEHEAKSESDN